MKKIPPIEKIAEAYTAIIDNRVTMKDREAIVLSSNRKKEYIVRWNDSFYYSSDNATYWQGYAGYPVIAVLMLQKRLSLDKSILKYFSNISWNDLNKKYKRDYSKVMNLILEKYDENTRNHIKTAINKVYLELEQLDISITRKKMVNIV